MGLGPSRDIAGHQFTGHGKEDFGYSANAELPDSVRPLQLRAGGLNAGTDFVAIFPRRCLLRGIHLISQPQFRGDLQPEGTGGFPCRATTFTMVGCAHRACIQHGTGAAGTAVKDGMKRPGGFVIAAENTVIDWAVSHRAVCGMTVCVKFELISPDHIVCQTSPVNRRH